MAEVPLPTPTQAPVPSTDIRNAVFAGAKLDEEVTGSGEFYTDRLGIKRLTNTGRNNQFNAAQQERADQFQQFLLSSGYVFLGDYEDGPFQFSARNQYIRYNDQYYRLNATTDVGFTTTGTDAISFANDVAHFVLMDGDTLRQNLGSGEGFKYIGQVRSAAVLALLPGTNGDRVLLTSYHELIAAEMPIGGGEFYYVSSLAGVNNGVTIFNGWCRKIINKTLTTYDAGLKPGDGSNASAKLQALADVLRGTSGFTLVGSGTHQVDRPIRFEGASFLKITGDFTVSAAERRDNWQHQGWDNDELPDAVLYFKNCPYLSIPRTVEVVGAKSWYRDYNPAQTYEMGDCGIRLYRCPHSYIEATVHHCFTWGIYSDLGDYVTVNQAHVYDCIRQSGVNICARSSHVSVLNCQIEDIGLYGIEAENFPSQGVDTKMVTIKGNIISRCNRGVSIVGNIERADVEGNIAINCCNGYFVRTESYSLAINISNSYAMDCQRGFEFASCSNVYAPPGNIITLKTIPDYVITSQYDAIMEWGADRTQYYVHGWAPLPQAFLQGNVTSFPVWINGVQYTVTGVTRDDNKSLGVNGGIAYSALIQLDRAVPADVELYTLVRYILTTNGFYSISRGVICRQYNSSFQMNENVLIEGFTIDGVNLAMVTS
ncbi:right-handed parallel beta-helix repeat-containing protein, partial [Raoultella ornithinolytica]